MTFKDILAVKCGTGYEVRGEEGIIIIITVSTYVTELQRKALRGLELGGAQVHVFADGGELLLRRSFLLWLVHGGRQGEVERAAGIVRLTHVHGAVTRDVLQAGTHFEKHLIAVLEDVWSAGSSRIKTTCCTKTETDTKVKEIKDKKLFLFSKQMGSFVFTS